MTLHKEGAASFLVIGLFILVLNALGGVFWFDIILLKYLTYALSIFLAITILQFFRKPFRQLNTANDIVYAPADGKVVVIEKTTETEYYKDERIQVSIFMSPINVHINWIPFAGIVKYFKYHPGKYLVAWHPKSSTENERTTLVLEHSNGFSVLMRQIAGAMARRIVWYVEEGQSFEQGNEFGFIKFGSRVDLYFPIGTEILVSPDQKVKGTQTAIAKLPLT